MVYFKTSLTRSKSIYKAKVCRYSDDGKFLGESYFRNKHEANKYARKKGQGYT